MDPKDRFRQSFAEEQDALARQPLVAETAGAEKRERWAQTVTPVSTFTDWLEAQKVQQGRQEFGFGGSGLEFTDHWTNNLHLYHRTLDEAGEVIARYVIGVLKLIVTPGSAEPFCWSRLDENGFFAIETHCHEDLDLYLNEVADAAARLFAQFKQKRIGQTRQT